MQYLTPYKKQPTTVGSFIHSHPSLTILGKLPKLFPQKYWFTGGCLEFASALRNYLVAQGFKASVLFGYMCHDSPQFSHCIVQVTTAGDNHTFDSTGPYALERWCDTGNMSIDFFWSHDSSLDPTYRHNMDFGDRALRALTTQKTIKL